MNRTYNISAVDREQLGYDEIDLLLRRQGGVYRLTAGRVVFGGPTKDEIGVVAGHIIDDDASQWDREQLGYDETDLSFRRQSGVYRLTAGRMVFSGPTKDEIGVVTGHIIDDDASRWATVLDVLKVAGVSSKEKESSYMKHKASIIFAGDTEMKQEVDRNIQESIITGLEKLAQEERDKFIRLLDKYVESEIRHGKDRSDILIDLLQERIIPSSIVKDMLRLNHYEFISELAKRKIAMPVSDALEEDCETNDELGSLFKC